MLHAFVIFGVAATWGNQTQRREMASPKSYGDKVKAGNLVFCFFLLKKLISWLFYNESVLRLDLEK